MENYADYQFYQEQYKGSLSDSLFSSYIIKASRMIDNNVNRELTNEVIENLNDRDKYRLKYAACELCDFISENGLSSSKNASSISIDGVSITNKEKSESSISKDKAIILAQLPLELIRYE